MAAGKAEERVYLQTLPHGHSYHYGKVEVWGPPEIDIDEAEVKRVAADSMESLVFGTNIVEMR